MWKHLKYASYVIRHRWFVFVECLKLGIIWRGLTHDLSKFLPSEWFPYANFFYDKAPDGGNRPGYKTAFDLAWLYHQHRNPHHWQYWRLREDDGGTKLIPMPLKYVKEMLADWRGAGKAQGFAELGPWYAKNHRKIELHEETRDLLHSLMRPDELPPKEKVLVIDSARFTGASLMSDGSVSLEGQVLESHEEER
jgi:hypothetical protein